MSSFRSYFLKKGIKLSVNRVMKKGVMEKVRIAERRKKLDALGTRLGSMPKNCKVETLEIGGLYTEWIIPEGVEEDKVILYLHGGGYAYCSAATHRPLAARIGKAANVRVLFPEYRKAPEHPFPAAIEDAVQVYHWLRGQGFQPKNIIFAGDSAGAGLCLATTLVLRDQNELLPAAIICLSPWVDLTSSGESYRKNIEVDPYLNVEGVRTTAHMYAGEESLDHPLISPVFANLTGIPPLYIQAGNSEILQSDAELLAKEARKDGVDVTFNIWDGMWHVFQISGDFLPEARKAVQEIGAFVKRTFHH